jgi:hypothetical protein
VYALTCDFPGAPGALVQAIMVIKHPLSFSALKTLTVGNGKTPLFSADQSFRLLFVAISVLCSETLEELNIDGGYQAPMPIGNKNEVPYEFDNPGAFEVENFYAEFKHLHHLHTLRIRNLPRLDDCVFWWLVGGDTMLGRPDPNPQLRRVLVLDNVPDLPADAIVDALHHIGDKLKELQIISPNIENPIGNLADTKKKWWQTWDYQGIDLENIDLNEEWNADKIRDFGLIKQAVNESCGNLKFLNIDYGTPELMVNSPPAHVPTSAPVRAESGYVAAARRTRTTRTNRRSMIGLDLKFLEPLKRSRC